MFSIFYSFRCIKSGKSAIALALVVLFFTCCGAAHGTDWVYETGDLRAVWGSAASDVFAVGKRGVILHYDGTRWMPRDSGVGDCALGFKLKDIWGSSATDVYAVGCYDSQGEDFEFCGENNGVILHYDGTAWETLETGAISNLMGLWGSSDSDIMAVGVDGAILHFDGTAWTLEESHTTVTLSAVWGTSGSDVFAVGHSGTILHYNGSGWSPMTSGTSATLNGVWGTSGTDVFAVGSGGTVLRYNGSDWEPFDPPGSGTTEDLAHIWGSSASNVFAAGDGGTILRFNGTSWSAQASSTTADLKGLWGSSGSNIFAVGDGSTIIRYNGSSWSIHSTGSPEDLQDAWGTSDNNVFAVGDNGTILRYSGSGWKRMDSGTAEDLFGIWGSSVNNVYAVGTGGTILQYNGSSWTIIHSDPATDFYDVWGSSEADVYAVGSVDTGEVPPKIARMRHYDGSGWTTTDFSFYNDAVYCMWGNSASDAFAYTNIYISGGGIGDPPYRIGVILHHNGTSWPFTEIGEKEYLYGFWGSGGDDVHAVGQYRDYDNQIEYLIVYHFDGSAWHRAQIDVPYDVDLAHLRAIWGRSKDDVFAVGDIGGGGYHGHVILRNTGGVWWVDRFSRAFHPLYGIWGDVAGDVFAVGAEGVIMRLPAAVDLAPSSGDPWTQTYGDMASDSGNAIAVTKDGGYIVAGHTSSFGGDDSDVWLLKLDLEGNIEWEKRYGGPDAESVSSVVQTRDGGFMVAGDTYSFGAGGSDVWILKLDGLGNVEWEKAYGGTQNDRAKDIQEMSWCDGVGYVVAAQTSSFGAGESDIWVFRLDAEGNIQWQRTYGGPVNEYVGSIVQAKGYGFAVAGETHSFDIGNGDFWVLRLDDNGDLLWQKAFGLWSFVPPDHTNHNVEYNAELAATKDGGFILAGASAPLGTNVRAWITKLDALGNVQWQRLYETTADYAVSSIQQTNDLGYVVGGRIGGGRSDGWIMKLDKDGNTEWQKAYGGSDIKDYDSIAAVRQVSDGSYVATGKTFSADLGDGDLWVLKLDDTGDNPECSAVSTWHGQSIPTTEPGVDTPATVLDIEATVDTTSATVNDTEAVQGDPCLSTLGDLIDLPQTGQTTSFHAGDDGDLRAGVAWPSPRFSDNGDGTITDNLTGLVWLRDANYADTLGHDPDGDGSGRMSWTSALGFVADMNAGNFANLGHTDWRLANVNEIDSLVNAEQDADHAAWLIGQGFSQVQNGIYWSSTTWASSTNYAWQLNLGQNGIVTKLRKSGAGHVWPVRQGQWFHPDPAYPANVAKTGQTTSLYAGDDGAFQAGVAWPSPRFTDHDDGTVTDNLTGLMWLKDAGCFVGLNWQNALDALEDLIRNPDDYQGVCHEYAVDYPDWRMPNRKELAGLFDRSRSSPGLPQGHPFENIPNYYTMSSNTINTVPYAQVWAFAPQSGAMLHWTKSTRSSVWPVRGVPSCQGDCEGDGDVGGADLAAFIVDFITDNPEGNCSVDFNNDGHVDGQDLAVFSRSFGRSDCPVLESE